VPSPDPWLTCSARARRYEDTSPLLESACAALALAVGLQRRAAAADAAAPAALADLASAVAALTDVRDSTLAPFYVPQTLIFRPRFPGNADAPSFAALRDSLASGSARRNTEPPMLSAAFMDALADALRGQARAAEALAAAGAGAKAAAAARFFAASRLFERARATLPHAPYAAAATRRTEALGFSCAARALLDAVDAAEAPLAARGVAVALARRAAETDAANAKLGAHALELERANELEYDMQLVPLPDSIALTYTADVGAPAIRAVEAVDGETGVSSWRLTLHLGYT